MHLVASITLLKERLTGITYIVCSVHVLCCIDPFLDPVDILVTFGWRTSLSF
jgi:hypothetical protein